MKPASVYFFCRDNPGAYHDDVVVLAEGLRELGIPTFGNCNYWKRSLAPDDWLVRHDPRVRPEDCDVVAVSYVWSRWLDSSFKAHSNPLPPAVLQRDRRFRTAFLDIDDGYETSCFRPEFRAFDKVFRGKFNGRCYQPANVVPWVHGFGSRVVASIGTPRPWHERKRELLVNFYASHSFAHPARTEMERKFVRPAADVFSINRSRDNLQDPPEDPYDRLMWEQTQMRHSRSYYDRLNHAQAVACFCGEFVSPVPFRPTFLAGGRKAKLRRAWFTALGAVIPRPRRLIQWDSWRFWEALVAGCVAFNFDLPYYGVELPVMPENFTHYIGVRTDNATDVLRRIQADPELLARVASAGRSWVLEHYSPAALASRFLATLEA